MKFDFGEAEDELKKAMLTFLDFLATKPLRDDQHKALDEIHKAVTRLPECTPDFTADVEFFTGPLDVGYLYGKPDPSDSKSFYKGHQVFDKYWSIDFYANTLEVSTGFAVPLSNKEGLDRLSVVIKCGEENWFKQHHPKELRYGQAEWMEEVKNLDRYVEEGWELQITIEAKYC